MSLGPTINSGTATRSSPGPGAIAGSRRSRRRSQLRPGTSVLPPGVSDPHVLSVRLKKRGMARLERRDFRFQALQRERQA